MSPRIRAAIFDVDGTLVDTVDLHAQAWAETFRRYGVDVPVDEVRREIGKGGDQLMPDFLSPEVIAETGEEIEQFRSALFKTKYLPKARGIPGAAELFGAVRARGMKIALASSCKADELEHYERLAGIEGLADVRTTSDDAEKSKPFPDIFEAVLKKLAVAPAEAVVIGDSPYDAEAARNAGLKTIGVLSGGFEDETLRQAGCIAVYRDVAELLQRLDESPLAEAAVTRV
jgi:HAD superfamily hydrolase (TIGR01509 family)